MKRYLLHTPFNIYHFEAAEWQHPLHNHTYFEIIFILGGKGTHNINHNSFEYNAGDVFLLGPEDFHVFDIKQKTEFCFIRFNEPFSKALTISEQPKWTPIIESLLHVSSKCRGSIVKNNVDKKKLHKLLTVLESEYEDSSSPYYEIIRDSLMRSIMGILAKNLRISDQPASSPSRSDSVEPILLYIKKNIYSPSRLSIVHLSREFHMAPTYISVFFKKHVGESIKQHITRYRIELIKARLTYSQLSLSEIAHEFGFTDESHFCKQFRKYCGLSPTQFRKKF